MASMEIHLFSTKITQNFATKVIYQIFHLLAKMVLGTMQDISIIMDRESYTTTSATRLLSKNFFLTVEIFLLIPT